MPDCGTLSRRFATHFPYEFTNESVFAPSLFVTIRKRIGSADFNDMSKVVLFIGGDNVNEYWRSVSKPI